MNAKDYSGMRCGRLTAIKLASPRRDPRGAARRYWLCRCDCGCEVEVSAHDLGAGHTKSCGCLKKDAAKKTHTTHGLSNTRSYHTWRNMMGRCYNANRPDYLYYGGRGIGVCDAWRRSFVSFLADMGRPPKGTTLDRIDNDADYGPSNCRWATREQQANNRRNNRRLTYSGVTASITQWSKAVGLPASTLRTRIAKKWPIGRALCEPLHTIMSRQAK